MSTEHQQPRGRTPLWRVILQRHGALVALVLLLAFMALREPVFFKPENLLNIVRQIAPMGIVALGMTFVIISGGIDLSVGALLALVGGASILAMNGALEAGQGAGSAVALAVAICLIGGPLLGLLNGSLVAYGRVAPFIATLGTMAIFRALTLSSVDGGEFSSQAGGAFHAIGGGGIALPMEVAPGVPLLLGYPVIAFLVLAFIAAVTLHWTRYGRHCIAVGSNEQASVYSAVPVARVKLITYSISGAMCGVAALLLFSRLNGGSSSQAGMLYELDAIAAVVIGGTRMEGGRGSIIGTVIGVLLLGVINNMLNMFDTISTPWFTIHISSYIQGLVKGLIIIAAVLLQRSRSAG